MRNEKIKIDRKLYVWEKVLSSSFLWIALTNANRINTTHKHLSFKKLKVWERIDSIECQTHLFDCCSIWKIIFIVDHLLFFRRSFLFLGKLIFWKWLYQESFFILICQRCYCLKGIVLIKLKSIRVLLKWRIVTLSYGHLLSIPFTLHTLILALSRWPFRFHQGGKFLRLSL